MSMADFNTQVITEFRENDGRVGGMFEGMPMILLAPRRRQVRASAIAPLVYLPDGDRYVIFASKGGAPENPAWYHNLKAHPDDRGRGRRADASRSSRGGRAATSATVCSRRRSAAIAAVRRVPGEDDRADPGDRADAQGMTDFDYDWLVIGSGFGGSVSALRLAEKGYSVARARVRPALRRRRVRGAHRLTSGATTGCPHLGMRGDPAAEHVQGRVRALRLRCRRRQPRLRQHALPRPARASTRTPSGRELADWAAELEPFYDGGRAHARRHAATTATASPTCCCASTASRSASARPTSARRSACSSASPARPCPTRTSAARARSAPAACAAAAA